MTIELRDIGFIGRFINKPHRLSPGEYLVNTRSWIGPQGHMISTETIHIKSEDEIWAQIKESVRLSPCEPDVLIDVDEKPFYKEEINKGFSDYLLLFGTGKRLVWTPTK